MCLLFAFDPVCSMLVNLFVLNVLFKESSCASCYRTQLLSKDFNPQLFSALLVLDLQGTLNQRVCQMNKCTLLSLSQKHVHSPAGPCSI